MQPSVDDVLESAAVDLSLPAVVAAAVPVAMVLLVKAELVALVSRCYQQGIGKLLMEEFVAQKKILVHKMPVWPWIE